MTAFRGDWQFTEKSAAFSSRTQTDDTEVVPPFRCSDFVRMEGRPPLRPEHREWTFTDDAFKFTELEEPGVQRAPASASDGGSEYAGVDSDTGGVTRRIFSWRKPPGVAH